MVAPACEVIMSGKLEIHGNSLPEKCAHCLGDAILVAIAAHSDFSAHLLDFFQVVLLRSRRSLLLRDDYDGEIITLRCLRSASYAAVQADLQAAKTARAP